MKTEQNQNQKKAYLESLVLSHRKPILISILVVGAVYFAVAFTIFGICINDSFREVKACQEFWGEPCEVHAVPKSGAEGFTVEYYKTKTKDGTGL